MASEKITLSRTTFELIAVTRVALGVGAGLLFADRLGREQRRKVGLSLLALGAVSTVSAVLAVRRGLQTRG